MRAYNGQVLRSALRSSRGWYCALDALGRCGDGVYSVGFERIVGELCEFAEGLSDGDVRGFDEWKVICAKVFVDLGVVHSGADGVGVGDGIVEDVKRFAIEHFDGHVGGLKERRLVMLERGEDSD